MQEKEINHETKKRIVEECVICLSPVLGSVVFFILQKTEWKQMLVQMVLCLFGACAFSLFLRMNQAFFRGRIRHPVYFYGCYVLSFLWLGLSGSEGYGCLWFLLIAFSALDAGVELAVFSDVFLMLVYAVMVLQTGVDFRFFITYFILGIMVAVLFSVFRSWREAGYLFVILVVLDAACHIFAYDFSLLEFTRHGQALAEELISILALALVGVFYITFISPNLRLERIVVKSTIAHGEVIVETMTKAIEEFEEKVPEKPAGENGEEETAEETVREKQEEELKQKEKPVKVKNEKPVKEKPVKVKKEKPVKEKPVKIKKEKPVKEEPVKEKVSEEGLLQEKKRGSDSGEIFRKIIQPDFPLIERLRQYSSTLYEHSRKISELAGGAAKLTGGDELLARAGGMYHEIGRITPSGNYIVAGEKIVKEAGFPSELIPVIRQHSPMFELPGSLEAAVVMLSDSIVSTEEYLMKNGQREQISDEHLIENIFQKRISKGNLNEVELSEEQIEKLKEYFIQNLSSVGR